MARLTVACVLRKSKTYDAEYVERLQAGIIEHLKTPHRFVCLSDVEVPCERIPLEHDWPGWWAKIELFKLKGPVLCFDLDTTIVGDLSDIASSVPVMTFIALRDFYREDGLGSGMMGWSGDVSSLYRAFCSKPGFCMERYRGLGDQGFLEDRIHAAKWQDLVPGQVVSYKVHCKESVPKGARVVCFHGKPKPHELPQNHVLREHW